ncbi:MAG: hypothetical protein ACLS8R_11605, partial [Anaeromassilibacillus sp.]
LGRGLSAYGRNKSGVRKVWKGCICKMLSAFQKGPGVFLCTQLAQWFLENKTVFHLTHSITDLILFNLRRRCYNNKDIDGQFRTIFNKPFKI